VDGAAAFRLELKAIRAARSELLLALLNHCGSQLGVGQMQRTRGSAALMAILGLSAGDRRRELWDSRHLQMPTERRCDIGLTDPVSCEAI
jgi:hypothetical protein